MSNEEKKEEKTALPKVPRNVIAYRWLHHIRSVYDEINPDLLKRHEVIQAYWALYERLSFYRDGIGFYNPPRSSRYTIGVSMKTKHDLAGMSYYLLREGQRCYYHTGQRPVIIQELTALYQQLYDLVKEDLESGLESRIKKNELESTIKTRKNQITYEHRMMERAEKAHQEKMERIRRYLDRLYNDVAKAEEDLSKL